MGISKTQNYTEFQNELANYARILSSPARIAILEILKQEKGCICRDIVEDLGLSQSTVSQHLKELKTIGLIQGDIDGPSVCYCIQQENWERMERMFQKFLNLTIRVKKGKIC